MISVPPSPRRSLPSSPRAARWPTTIVSRSDRSRNDALPQPTNLQKSRSGSNPRQSRRSSISTHSLLFMSQFRPPIELNLSLDGGSPCRRSHMKERLYSPAFQTHPTSANLTPRALPQSPEPAQCEIERQRTIFDESLETPYQGKCSQLARKIVQHRCTNILMACITIYALFFDDIRLLAVAKEYDPIFFSLSTLAFLLFATELLLSCAGVPGYTCGFFFWLDLLATMSVISDIGWVWDPLIGQFTDANSAASVAKTSRASRAARIIRFVRLLRLIRLVKLYKQARVARKLKARLPPATAASKPAHDGTVEILEQDNHLHPARRLSSLGGFAGEAGTRRDSVLPVVPEGVGSGASEFQQGSPSAVPEVGIASESRISRKLSELTTKRVILLILTLLFLLPLFNSDTYVEAEHSFTISLAMLSRLYGTPHFTKSYERFQADHSDTEMSLVKLTVHGQKLFQDSPFLDSLRSIEKGQIELNKDPLTAAVYSRKQFVKGESWINLGRTLFVAALLAIGSLEFERLAQTLVLGPIERMLEKVKLIALNPMLAVDEEAMKHAGMLSVAQQHRTRSQRGRDIDSHETAILERTVVKIGQLLAIGFGEAGGRIITDSMTQGGGEVRFASGSKVFGIFGFCDIRRFTDATEVLQTDVMVFVNQVAEVVHSVVDRFKGSANKNIGDAFLVVWKFPPPTQQAASKPALSEYRSDLAVLAFLKIIARVNKLTPLLAYSRHEELLKRMPGYKLQLGFGLHCGWAIEGAIGSQFKIDASYLSPNVNLASRLQAATKQYGVPLLISDALARLCSEQMQELLREIDCVYLKGSAKPIHLYTVDLDVSQLAEVDEKYAGLPARTKKRLRINEKAEFWRLISRIGTGDYCSRDIDILTMRREVYPSGFLREFQEGYAHYLRGEWGQARQLLERAQQLRPSDGPCANLVSFMQSQEWRAPEDWQGVRELLEK